MFQICNTIQYIDYSIVDKDVKKQFEVNSKQVNILQTASLMYSLWFLSLSWTLTLVKIILKIATGSDIY